MTAGGGESSSEPLPPPETTTDVYLAAVVVRLDRIEDLLRQAGGDAPRTLRRPPQRNQPEDTIRLDETS